MSSRKPNAYPSVQAQNKYQQVLNQTKAASKPTTTTMRSKRPADQLAVSEGDIVQPNKTQVVKSPTPRPVFDQAVLDSAFADLDGDVAQPTPPQPPQLEKETKIPDETSRPSAADENSSSSSSKLFQREYISRNGKLYARAVETTKPESIEFFEWEKSAKTNKNVRSMYTSWNKTKIQFVSCPMEFIGPGNGNSVCLKVSPNVLGGEEGQAFIGFLHQVIDVPYDNLVNQPNPSSIQQEVMSKVRVTHTVNADGFMNPSISSNLKILDHEGRLLEGYSVQDIPKTSPVIIAASILGRRVTETPVACSSKAIMSIQQIKLLNPEDYPKPKDIGNDYNLFAEPGQPLVPVNDNRQH